MASVPPPSPDSGPDPRTAADDDEDATPLSSDAPGGGVSATDPAEGGDDSPGQQPGSARG